eukprot:3966636-Amphidinium_carterae.2
MDPITQTAASPLILFSNTLIKLNNLCSPPHHLWQGIGMRDWVMITAANILLESTTSPQHAL